MPIWKILLWAAGGAVLVFWPQICHWFATHANPWLKQHCPWLQPHLQKAFEFIDENVALPLRRAVLAAWEKVRPYVLRALLEFERRVDGAWVRRITSFLRQKLEGGEITRRVEETVVDWSELPEEVRASFMRNGHVPAIDLVEAREQSLAHMTEEH